MRYSALVLTHHHSSHHQAMVHHKSLSICRVLMRLGRADERSLSF